MGAFIVFRDRDRDLSLLSAWSRLAYTVMLGVGVVFLVQALQLVDAGGFLAELTRRPWRRRRSSHSTCSTPPGSSVWSPSGCTWSCWARC